MIAAGESKTRSVPETGFTPRQIRILKIATVVMGILLVGGFAFVLAAIVYQASRPGQDVRTSAAPAGEAAEIELPVPPNAALTGLSLDGNRLAIHLKGSGGSEIAVIDLASGSVVARVRLAPDKP